MDKVGGFEPSDAGPIPAWSTESDRRLLARKSIGESVNREHGNSEDSGI